MKIAVRRATNANSLRICKWAVILATIWMLPMVAFGQQPNANNATAADEQPPERAANQPLPGEQPPEKAYRYWTTNWSFDSIDVGNVLSRLRQVGIDVPVDAAGEVTVRFSVSVPLNGLRTGRAYKFSGTLTSQQLRLEQLLLTNLTTDIRYANGRLDFENIVMRWVDQPVTAEIASSSRTRDVPAGVLTGEGAFQLIPQGGFVARLDAESLAIEPLYALITETVDRPDIPVLSGSVTGEITAKGLLSQLGDLAEWTIKANVVGKDLSIRDSPPLTIATGPISLENSRVEASNVRLGSPIDPSIRLAASLEATLTDTLPFDFRLRGDDVPLPTLTSLVSLGDDIPVAGKLDVDLTGSGQLRPEDEAADWNIAGRIASPDLAIYGLRLGLIEHELDFNARHFQLTSLRPMPIDSSVDARMIIQKVSANYEITDTAISLANLNAEIFEGKIDGEANFATASDGIHDIDLRWDQLQPDINTEAFLPAAVELTLQTSGSVRWQVPVETIDRLGTHRGQASVVIDTIELGDAAIGDVQQ